MDKNIRISNLTYSETDNYVIKNNGKKDVCISIKERSGTVYINIFDSEKELIEFMNIKE